MGRVLLILVGLALLAGAFVWSRFPKPAADRVEAALDVVGVETGGSYAWILKTPNGAALIDAGLDPDAQAILGELRDQGLTADQVHTILLTHGHQDHWGGASKFPNAKVYVSTADLPLARGEVAPSDTLRQLFKKVAGDAEPPQELVELKEEGPLALDGTELQVFLVPGHTPGSAAFLYQDLLFVGDAASSKGGEVTTVPGFMSHDPDENLRSLQKLKDLPFTRMADGHAGVTADARSKLRRLLE